jgi:hypothetical protein
MENRIIIKKINFVEDTDEITNSNKLTNNSNKDIKIKLYHNKTNQISETIWDYENNDIINWKFIINYNENLCIDFIILENDIFEQDNIIGHGSIKNEQGIILNDNIFPEPIINKINIEKNNKIVCILKIEQYIINKTDNIKYNCGNGWSLPDENPKLDSFPYKNRNEIFQNIRLIENNYNDDTQNQIYSDAFSKIIEEPNNKPPICFGIIAPDNYGKSRFLQSLKKKIDQPNKVIINFNPWNFEAADIIWASILTSIHNALETKFGSFNLKLLRLQRLFCPDTKQTILFILKISLPTIIAIFLGLYIYFYNTDIIYSIILSIGLVISSLMFFKDSFELIKNLLFSISDIIIRKIKKPDWRKELGFMNEIKEEFLDFINPVIKKYDCKLILLIDDLDKCSIEKIYSVIKVLSLLKYSDCPIYIFICYDSIKINDAIKSYYRNKNLINTYEGKHLLDKLIDIPFCLPEKNILENLSLLDKYIKKDEENITLSEEDNSMIFLTIKKSYNNEDKLNQIEINVNKNILTFYQLENYYKYLIKLEKELPNENKIKQIKDLIYSKFIELKKNFKNNYYTGLDNDEINLFQNILQETKYSDKSLNNTKIIKIINMYTISRFLLPNYLKNKKNKLFHLLLITENWHEIIIQFYIEIKKKKTNLNLIKIKECFEDKDILFFYLNNEDITKNDELIIYLSKFEIKIMDFIELEIFMINLDRCYLNCK